MRRQGPRRDPRKGAEVSRTKQQHFAHFGPSIPVVPIGDFRRMALTPEQWADAWSICGSSAAKNMEGGFRKPPLQLWQVIASAYLEGLQHGAELAAEDAGRRALAEEEGK